MTDDSESSDLPRTSRRRRAGEGRKPTGEGRKPTGEGRKPNGEGKKPNGAGNKPTGGDPRVPGTEVDPPIDIDFPKGPVWVPQNPGESKDPKGGSAFDLKAWDHQVPILLLPIRLETKYVGGADNGELRIRILPDPATVPGATPATEGELAEARDFWTQYYAAAGSAQRSATWRQYARRLGSQRAGFVARLTRPTVDADGRITFPKVAADLDGPALVSLLPNRWMATGWVGDTVAFQEVGNPIKGPLATSPDPTVPTKQIAGTGLQIDPATAWLFDYEAAVGQGMAITVPLVGQAAKAASGVSTLVVIGIDESQQPAKSAQELAALFEQHARSEGLAFVPQGTPTNNTDTVEAGYRREEAELDDLEERELGTYQPHIDDNASRLAGALGIADVARFGRLAHGTDREHERSRDMRIALFEVVFGTYARQLVAAHASGAETLGGGLDDEIIGALREWFIEWVCGGAPVPTIRIGRQPYGILPAMCRQEGEHSSPTGSRVAQTVDVLIEEWRAALASVPVLDHNATDTITDEAEVREAVTAVLSNNPHPRRLVVRTASDWSDQPRPTIDWPGTRSAAAALPAAGGDEVEFPPADPVLVTGGFRWEYDDAIDTLETDYEFTLKQLYDAVVREVASGRPDTDVLIPQPTVGRTIDPHPFPGDESSIRGIEEQIKIWVETDLAIDDYRAINVEIAEIFPQLHEFCADIIGQLESHELRQRPLRWLDVPGLDGVLGRSDLQLLLTKFSGAGPLWERASVQDVDPPAGVTAARYLSVLSDRLSPVAGPGARTGPIDLDGPFGDTSPSGGIDLPDFILLPPEFIAAAPLLYQLIFATIGMGDRIARSEAVARLAGVDPEQLDWLLRETLGLGSHRLDAWHTSLATERLSALRADRPTGVYVGSYGFVLDLNRSTERASNGFIHAPSLPHAASAAVLRSGWLARGNEDAESPAAIDLSSRRVRYADWLLSGVRNGQDLGDLLGVRFERYLHDALLDVAIRPLRLAVGDADGLGDSAGDIPVDGARLLDLYRAGELDDTITDLKLSATDEIALLNAIADIESGFDAVDDATTFETVHQLVVGNLDRAAAVVDSMGPNGGRPPELDGIRTPRNALTIDTRALVLIEAASTSEGRGWSAGTRDLLDPALDAWVASMLPDARDVGWLAVGATGKDIQMNLGDLEVSALDACYLANDDPRAVSPSFRRLAELANDDIVEIHPDLGGSAPITLTEFQLHAVELRRLAQESTPADARALAAPEDTQTVDAEGTAVPDHVGTALDGLLELFGTVGTKSEWTALTPGEAQALARIGLVPSATVDPKEDFASLQARLLRRIKAHDAVEESTSLKGARQRAAALVGIAAPILAPFVVPGADGIQFDAELASDDDVDDWFDLVSTVRPNLANLWRAVGIGGVLGVAPPAVVAGQYPRLADDEWACRHRPQLGTGGRVAAAAVTHGDVVAGRSVVGIVIDQWSERIPADDQVTGVAFHYDAPSTQAPQTMLLAVPPEGRRWSTDLVLDTVLETIEWAQLRTVAIDDLGDYGHALPTTFVPGQLEPGLVLGAAT